MKKNIDFSCGPIVIVLSKLDLYIDNVGVVNDDHMYAYRGVKVSATIHYKSRLLLHALTRGLNGNMHPL